MNKLIKGALAALLLAGGTVGAYALVVDAVRIVPPRIFATQQTHYLRFTVNFSDPNVTTARLFARVPNNSYIMAIDADVTTAFTSGATISLGASTTATEIMAASGSNASVAIGSTGITHVTAAAGLGVAVTGNSTYQGANSSGVPIYVKLAGTTATVGAVTFVLTYMPDNDQ